MLPENPRFPDKFDWPQTKAALEEWAFRLLNSQMFVPPGVMVEYGGTTAPDGWVEMDGQEYDQAKFSDLYKVIGTTYGGTATTFMVPNEVATVGQIWIIKV